MSAHRNTRWFSPLKTVLGKIGEQYQAYCTTYKAHTMVTYHGGAGCPLNRGLDIHRRYRTCQYWQWQHPQFRCHSCLRRPRSSRSPWRPCTQKPRQVNSPHRRDKWLVSKSSSQRRSTSRDPESHTARSAKSANHPPSAIATWTCWTFGEVLHQYMDSLCSTQKESNLTNSLMQDIPVFNEHDSTKLEDWLLDIEMAADLTSKSRARLAKAKSQGLTFTLVTEAISSNKSWDEIKDLLRLKLCNVDIHTYTSQFMEIQQWEKESLAGYIHQFRMAAKRCNFINDVATIRIFIKGLKNAHSLATCLYEKGLQMHNDAISEVEKLNPVQQLTATITPPSMVNMMTNDEDRCFQCQEHGHMARHCPNI